jgi:hypothetical protein
MGSRQESLSIGDGSSQSEQRVSRLSGRSRFDRQKRIQDLGDITPSLDLYLAMTGQTSTPEQFGVGDSQFDRGTFVCFPLL